MMPHKLYLTGVEEKPGKSFVSLSLLSALTFHHENISCYKLFEEQTDYNQIELLQAIAKHDISPLMPLDKARSMAETNLNDLINLCIEKTEGSAPNTIGFFEGTNFDSDNTSFEYQFNLNIAHHLNCDVILVVSAKDRGIETILSVSAKALQIAKKYHAHIIGIIFNRVTLTQEHQLLIAAKAQFNNLSYFSLIPEFESLAQPAVSEVIPKLNAQILCGQEQLSRKVKQITVAAKTLSNFLQSRLNREGMLIITPLDRVDILMGSLLADQSVHYPKIAGIVLTGGGKLEDIINKILQGLDNPFPVLVTEHKTYETATILYSTRFHISAKDESKLYGAIEKVRPYLNESSIIEILQGKPVAKITPSIFLFQLSKRARSDIKHIVLPEGLDERILSAADFLLKRNLVKITLLGNKQKITRLAKHHGLSLPGVKIIEFESKQSSDYATTYLNLRKHKNINEAIAKERMFDSNYYGAMMVYKGHADGMVSGAIHTTADTVRPALEIIKTDKFTRYVSSIFIMCLPTRILIYGDCAINPNPDANTLAEIAYHAAMIASRLGIEPKVALLSYSSGSSGSGESVEKIKKAHEILKKLAPTLLAEGPIQYDAAVDKTIAKKKLPQSKVAGSANVLIFPDLNTGNNTYKAVQRETGSLAIGPILLGLNKPVNDLSRGCNTNDVINTILITAIQAQKD
jgi:phosphate acetyltransferase